MLKLDNITIKFGGLVAVNQLSFEIEQGEIFGLIGPNGAGKTTTFNMISGTFEPTEGQIELEGKRIDGMPMFKINRLGIARTYQNINLFRTMTVLENVLVGLHPHLETGLPAAIFKTPKQRREEQQSIEKAKRILDLVHIKDKDDWYASSLSYGEQRRLEIGRALASDPKLLLLDEPAAGMNPIEKEELAELVRKIRDTGVTVLLVEHDMKFVMGICEEITVLEYGKIIAHGDPETVSNDPRVIAAYLGGDDD
ncbi:MAG: ABC transporter ATP-binding protein [Ruminococcaceae bacterium]|nr:ABC transporter ATP-binding protein [Oscillospiraceae bacterium]